MPDENDTSVSEVISASVGQVRGEVAQQRQAVLGLQSSITNLAARIEDLRQQHGGSRLSGGAQGYRTPGTPIPVHSEGSAIPRAINLAAQKASLLDDGAAKFSAYVSDLLTATGTLTTQLAEIRAVTRELESAARMSRSPQGQFARRQLEAYAISRAGSTNLNQIQRNLSNTPQSAAEYRQFEANQAFYQILKGAETSALAGTFLSKTEPGRIISKEQALRVLEERGISRSGTTEESRTYTLERFLEVAKERPDYLRALGEDKDLLKNLRESEIREGRSLALAGGRASYREQLLGGKLENITGTNIGDIDKEHYIERSSRILGLADVIRERQRDFSEALRKGAVDPEKKQELRKIFESFAGRSGEGLETLRGQLKKTEEKLEQPASPEEQEQNETLVNALRELISTLEKSGESLEVSSNNQAKSIAGLVSSVIGALSVQQFAAMKYISQPYQYQTQPALQMMGNTGMMGEALSGAFGAQEAVLQSYREFGGSVGGNIGGLLGFGAGSYLTRGLSRAGLPGMVGAAVITGGAAAAVSYLGTRGGSSDFIADRLGGKTAEEAFNANFAATMLNAQRFSQEFLLPTMPARVNLDFLKEPGINQAAALGELSTLGARTLGYDAVMNAQILSSGLSMLRPNVGFYDPFDMASGQQGIRTEGGARGMVETVAQLEGFGMTKESALGLLSSFSAAGSEDLTRSLDMVLAATSSGGDLSNFSVNVLAPALAKVVESRSIQAIAKSSEEVEKETVSFAAFFKNSDTALGRMLGASPELMSNMFGMLDQVGDTALQDPALMLFLNRMGVSYSDVLRGSPETLMRPMELFSQYADYDPSGNIDRDSMNTISSTVGFLQSMGIGVNRQTMNLTLSMFEALQKNGGTFSPGEATARIEELFNASPEGRLPSILEQLNARLGEIAGSPNANIIRNTVRETNTFFELMTRNAGAIEVIQSQVQEMLSNGNAMQTLLLTAAISSINEIRRIAGIEGQITPDTFNRLLQEIRDRNAAELAEETARREAAAAAAAAAATANTTTTTTTTTTDASAAQGNTPPTLGASTTVNNQRFPQFEFYDNHELPNQEELQNARRAFTRGFSGADSMYTTNLFSDTRRSDFGGFVPGVEDFTIPKEVTLGRIAASNAAAARNVNEFRRANEAGISETPDDSMFPEERPLYTRESFNERYRVSGPNTQELLKNSFNFSLETLTRQMGTLDINSFINPLDGLFEGRNTDVPFSMVDVSAIREEMGRTGVTPPAILESFERAQRGYVLTLLRNFSEQNPGSEDVEELINRISTMFEFATGGYTGVGTRLDPVGVVHGGEYVISDNNVKGNFNTLERMQAGEKMDDASVFFPNTSYSDDVIRVTLEFSNTNPQEIINAARMSAFSMLREERLI